MIEMAQSFHLLRPGWLLALIPAAALVWMLARPGADDRGWERVVDAHLLRHLLGPSNSVRRHGVLALLSVALLIAVLALAGPAWSKAPHATYRAQQARVIVLSLAPSMDAADIAPSRLARARLKVLDILARQREGQTALIAYSGEPYVVAPLTEDAKTIAALVPVLTTDLMPVAGDVLSTALQRAAELLARANTQAGTVIVITDSPGDAPSSQAAGALRKAGHRVSVLAVGRADGAPIPQAGGGFLKDAGGAIVVHKVDEPALMKLASIGGGAMAALSVDDSDLAIVLGAADSARAEFETKASASAVTQWRDEGPWLVWLLMPLVALLFRRGWLVTVAVVTIAAAPWPSHAFELEQLWLRKDQQAQRALRAEDYERAAELAEDPLRKGEALYRARKYEQAAEAFAQVDSPDGHYNRGNALAKSGRYADALAAYEAALRKIPNHADAKHNRALIEELLKRDPPPQSAADQQAADQQQGQQRRQQKQNQQQQQQSQAQSSARDTGDGMQGAQDARPGDQNAAASNSKKEAAQAAQPDIEKKSPAPVDQAASRPEAAPARDGGSEAAANNDSPEDREARQAAEQWLGRVPDDPGGLLREKFRREHLRRLQNEARGAPR